MRLRKYQEEALSKLMWDKDQEGNSLVVIPQGGGKSHVIAAYAETIDSPVLVLQPSREILEQNYNKMLDVVDEGKVGIYSASFGRKEIRQFTFATIQSIYTKPELFKHIETVIIDEADLLNPRKTGMYKDFVKAIDATKVVGFTGTPYRLRTMYRRWGELPWQLDSYTVPELINRVFPPFWKRILYALNTQDLIDQGYLSPLKYIDATLIQHEKIPVNKSKSDFNLDKYWNEVKEKDIVKEVDKVCTGYKSILVFCSSVEEAELLERNCFNDHNTAVVSHKTPKKERKRIIDSFKSGEIYAVFNVQTLTVGFDHPELDCIVLTRPTRSIRLYNQMIGRGTRIHDNKTHCTVIDFSGTVKALGRLETFKVEKVEGKWEIVSEKGYWHHKELYSFRFKDAVDTASSA